MKRIGLWAAICAALVVLSSVKGQAQTLGASALLDRRLAVVAHGYGGKQGFLYLADVNLSFCGGWSTLKFSRDDRGEIIGATGTALGGLWTNNGAFLGWKFVSASFTISQITVQWAGVSGTFAVQKPWMVCFTR